MNIELYNAFLQAKERVKLIQEQIQTLNQTLYTAENNLLELDAQIRTASNDALLQTLL